MSIFNVLRPDRAAEKITDAAAVTTAYRYWRTRVFYSIYMGYALYYFTRKAFTYSIVGLEQSLGYGKTELGVVASIFGLSYAFSKLINGFISDKANLRRLMSFGLIATGICNIFFGFSSSVTLFGLLMGLNAFFQGWGAPPCAKFLTYWYAKKERGRWWGLWNTSHNLGGALIPMVCAFALQYLGWRYAFHLPAVLAILVGFVLLNRLRDRPSTVGLPEIETFHYEEKRAQPEEEERKEKPLSWREILIEHVLKNKFIWLLGFAYFFVYLIREAVSTWVMPFMVEAKGFSVLQAGSAITFFETGGFVGALAAGWLSDMMFGGKRAPVNILFSLGIFASLFAMWALPSGNVWLLGVTMSFMGFFVFGPQLLIGLAAAELADKAAAGTATGFVGFFAYLGGFTAGAPCAKIIVSLGYGSLLRILGVCVVITVVLLFPLLIKKVRAPAIETGSAG